MASLQTKTLVLWVAGLVVLGCVVAATVIATQGPEALKRTARLVILPGVIADMVLSGNVHSGFADSVLDNLVGIGGAWVSWMLPVWLVIWIFTRKRASHDSRA